MVSELRKISWNWKEFLAKAGFEPGTPSIADLRLTTRPQGIRCWLGKNPHTNHLSYPISPKFTQRYPRPIVKVYHSGLKRSVVTKKNHKIQATLRRKQVSIWVIPFYNNYFHSSSKIVCFWCPQMALDSGLLKLIPDVCSRAHRWMVNPPQQTRDPKRKKKGISLKY